MKKWNDWVSREEFPRLFAPSLKKVVNGNRVINNTTIYKIGNNKIENDGYIQNTIFWTLCLLITYAFSIYTTRFSHMFLFPFYEKKLIFVVIISLIPFQSVPLFSTALVKSFVLFSYNKGVSSATWKKYAYKKYVCKKKRTHTHA